MLFVFPAPRRAVLAALLAAGGLVLTACSGGSTPSTPKSTGYRGDALPQPVTLSPTALSTPFRSTGGGSTTLGRLQRGNLMLLYFGYTHCPDVCPTTMADLGTALRQLPPIDQGHTRVVFVTSDPARDSPAVMKSWLSNFDPSLPAPFVGLTSSLTRIDALARSVGVPLSAPVREANGTISVEHGAQTLAFVHGKASVLWLAGTTPGDYAHDIAQLITTVGTP